MASAQPLKDFCIRKNGLLDCVLVLERTDNLLNKTREMLWHITCLMYCTSHFIAMPQFPMFSGQNDYFLSLALLVQGGGFGLGTTLMLPKEAKLNLVSRAQRQNILITGTPFLVCTAWMNRGLCKQLFSFQHQGSLNFRAPALGWNNRSRIKEPDYVQAVLVKTFKGQAKQ